MSTENFAVNLLEEKLARLRETAEAQDKTVAVYENALIGYTAALTETHRNIADIQAALAALDYDEERSHEGADNAED